jgi:hypothetical protein
MVADRTHTDAMPYVPGAILDSMHQLQGIPPLSTHYNFAPSQPVAAEGFPLMCSLL